MMGTPIARPLAMAALAVVLVAACKKGQTREQSTTVAAEKSDPPLPSGTLSLQGMYTYMADARAFVDCATGERWPVATEGDEATLERAYLQSKVTPPEPLLVTVEGRLESRPEVDGRGSETNLIVERFVRTWPRETCGSTAEAPLQDTRWVLLELDGTPIVVEANAEAPYLELSSTKASAYGFGGCNRFFGSYQVGGASLRFGAMGATRMACPEGMDQEQAFLRALEATTRYEVYGSKLLLFSDDALLARFEAP